MPASTVKGVNRTLYDSTPRQYPPVSDWGTRVRAYYDRFTTVAGSQFCYGPILRTGSRLLTGWLKITAALGTGVSTIVSVGDNDNTTRFKAAMAGGYATCPASGLFDGADLMSYATQGVPIYANSCDRDVIVSIMGATTAGVIVEMACLVAPAEQV